MVVPIQHRQHTEAYPAMLDSADAEGYFGRLHPGGLPCDDDPDGLALAAYPFYPPRRRPELSDDGYTDLDDEPAEAAYASSGSEILAGSDTVEIYLREMSRVPLLSVDQELDLARRVDCGRMARAELERLGRRLRSARRGELEATLHDAALAREHLIKANTRLVVSIAKLYIGRGVPFLDLVQEGNLGLMKAVEKYEYQRGFRFSTYATWWIRQTISRAVADQGRTIRLPVHMSDRIRILYRAAAEMEQELGRPPRPEELARRIGVSNKKVRWMLQVAKIPLSLESPVGDEEDSELGMFVEDQQTPTPPQVVYENLLRERMDELLNTLTPREARILALRFGLNQDRPYTLEEVGAKFGLTRERIRQIEGNALRRLRQPSRSRQLREYL